MFVPKCSFMFVPKGPSMFVPKGPTMFVPKYPLVSYTSEELVNVSVNVNNCQSNLCLRTLSRVCRILKLCKKR